MQQEQRRSSRELRRPFERPRNCPSGGRVVDLRQNGDLGRRLGLARARRNGSRITGESLLISVVPITRVVRLLGRMGGADNSCIRRQLTGVTQKKQQD